MINDELSEIDLNEFGDDAFESPSKTVARNTVDPQIAAANQRSLRERFNNMGIKLSTDPSTISEGAVPVTQGNIDLYQKIQRIKNGAARGEMKSISTEADKIASRNAPPPIHQPRKNKQQRPVQQSTHSAPAVESFIPAGGSREARDIEDMFTTGGGSYIADNGQISHIREDDFGASTMPSFDPVSILQQRAAAKGVNIAPKPKQAPTQSSLLNNVPQEDLVQIMETVSRRVSEDMLKKVIKEFSVAFTQMQQQQQQSKNVFEVYNKEKNIIKIGDQLYMLQPVRIKGKS